MKSSWSLSKKLTAIFQKHLKEKTMCKNCCGEAPEMGEGMIERSLMNEAQYAPANGLDIAEAEPTPESRLDVMDMRHRERIEAVRDEMSKFMISTSRNTDDIWQRLNRIEAVLGLPPIGDSGPKVRW